MKARINSNDVYVRGCQSILVHAYKLIFDCYVDGEYTDLFESIIAIMRKV